VAMFSPIVMCGKSPICWITYPIPRRSSTSGSSRMLRPSILISPSSKSINLLTSFSAVVLPPPDGPTSTQNVPAGMVKVSSWSAASARPG